MGDVTPDSVLGIMMFAVEHPHYSNIKCPALAIYSVPNSAQQLLPYYNTLDADNKVKAHKLFEFFSKFSLEQRNLFKKQVANRIIKEIKNANHYIFISNAEETEGMIRQFLN